MRMQPVAGKLLDMPPANRYEHEDEEEKRRRVRREKEREKERTNYSGLMMQLTGAKAH